MLDWSLPGWKPVRPVDQREGGGWISEAHGGRWGKVKLPQDWVVALGVGQDDLLISAELITYAHRDCALSGASRGERRRAVVSRVPGSGVRRRGRMVDEERPVQGSILSLKDLKVLCPITGKL